jgi:hypothetical protein
MSRVRLHHTRGHRARAYASQTRRRMDGRADGRARARQAGRAEEEDRAAHRFRQARAGQE